MKAKTIALSNNHCKKCNTQLEWRTHPELTPKQQKRAFHYSRWEYCTGCKTVWFSPAFIVWNKNDKGRYVRGKTEIAEQMDFLRSLE